LVSENFDGSGLDFDVLVLEKVARKGGLLFPVIPDLIRNLDRNKNIFSCSFLDSRLRGNDENKGGDSLVKLENDGWGLFQFQEAAFADLEN
jgi:hypothetical protein